MFHWLSRLFAKPVKRSPERQRQVDEESNSLILYYFPLCPYCHRVNRVVRRLSLNIEHRNAARSTEWADELLHGGGKMQVPCLRMRRPEGNEWLYESEDIIRFLRQRFATSEDFPT